MEIGMLWYDDDTKRKLDDKVARAVEYYRTKYGMPPTVCFVNPNVLAAEGAPEVAAGVRLRPARTVLMHHFWIGLDEAAQPLSSVKSSAKRPSRN